MNTEADLMPLEEATKWLLENGYQWKNLMKFTNTELQILATDQKARLEA